MTILIQGQLFPYTLDTYFYYKANLKEKVFLSTWKEDFENLDDSRKENIEKDCLILSEKPYHAGRHNINFQCKSTLEGMKHIQKMVSEDEYIVKTRSDQRVDIDQLKNTVEDFSKKNKSILGIDLYTRRYVPFHLGDMFLIMKLKDHLNYWDYKDKKSQDQYDFWQKSINRFDLDKKIFSIDGGINIPEVALLYNYIRKKEQIGFNLKEWIDFFNKEVCIVNASDLRLRSIKFDNALINRDNQIQASFFSPKHLVASSLIIGCINSDETIKYLSEEKLKKENLKIYMLDIFKVSIKLLKNSIKRVLGTLYNMFVFILKGTPSGK